MLIDNRGGQAGVLGTDAVAKAAPDGYTIGIVSASALVINPTMEKVPYDVAKDFAPVTLVDDGAGDAGRREQRSRQQHERNWSRSPRRSPANSILPPPASAACRIWPANCSS